MPKLSSVFLILAIVLVLLFQFMAKSVQAKSALKTEIKLGQLKQEEELNGFLVKALYLNDSEQAIGARFKHKSSAFTVDLLQIESVPQAFIWANTVLDTNSGVSHTQEHLLLGKGNKGRNHGTLSQMALVTESAGTGQWRTYYHFNTSAGKDVFYRLCKQYLDMLLYPDYTDEEIRREVCNFKVKEEGKSKTLVLSEAGTVYNEMRSAERSPDSVIWRACMNLVYGPLHPIACENGGSSEGIRKLSPAEIRKFHDKNYVLSNMGMIASLPAAVPVTEFLSQLDLSLRELNRSKELPDLSKSDIPVFPAPKPAEAGLIQIVSAPEKNLMKPGTVDLIWPAQLDLPMEEWMLLQHLLTNLAGDADTPLYKIFVDSKTLKVDSGATGIGGWVLSEPGSPVIFSIYDVSQEHMNEKDIDKYRKLVLDAIAQIASMKDGSLQLAEFNKKVMGTLAQDRRSYSDFVNKPPKFGTRFSGTTMMEQLLKLEKIGGFERHLTFKPEINSIEKLLKDNQTNFWKTYIEKWKLLNTVPYAVGIKQDPALLTKDEEDLQARLRQETERLKKQFRLTNDADALKAYRNYYEQKTAELEKNCKDDSECRKFIDSPPLGFDEFLDYKLTELPGKIPFFQARFQSMTSSNTIVAFKLKNLPEEDLIYLAAFPNLLTATGVIESGEAVSYEKMLDRLRKEIFYMNAFFNCDVDKERFELKIQAAGSNLEETKKSIEWMELVLFHPYWHTDNLARIKDLVEQYLSILRNTRNSAYEETWDRGVEQAFRKQHNPLMLNTQCFLTMTHNTQRLKWRLRGNKKKEVINEFVQYMKLLAESASKYKKQKLENLLSKLDKRIAQQLDENKELFNLYLQLSDEAKVLVADAASDLIQCLPDIPDDSLKNDFAVLCHEMACDLQIAPEKTFAKLNEIRQKLLSKAACRVSIVGSDESLAELAKILEKFVGKLDDNEFKESVYSGGNLVSHRYLKRTEAKETGADKLDSPYVALENPSTKQGIVYFTAPGYKYTDTDDDTLIKALALNLYGGAGAHGLFMRTWGAGLAYGNGPSSGPDARISYYADKMPSAPETLRFVAGELKKAKPDKYLLDYALALFFHTRAGSGFEQRADAMFENLVDGITPELVRRFRERLLEIRKEADLLDKVKAHLLSENGKVIPGLGVKGKDVKDAVYMSIGDSKQLDQLEDYLKELEDPDCKISRLWARDFWINMDETDANAN